MLAAREKYVYFPCTVFIFFFNFADLIGYCRPFLLQANLLIWLRGRDNKSEGSEKEEAVEIFRVLFSCLAVSYELCGNVTYASSFANVCQAWNNSVERRSLDTACEECPCFPGAKEKPGAKIQCSFKEREQSFAPPFIEGQFFELNMVIARAKDFLNLLLVCASEDIYVSEGWSFLCFYLRWIGFHIPGAQRAYRWAWNCTIRMFANVICMVRQYLTILWAWVISYMEYYCSLLLC